MKTTRGPGRGSNQYQTRNGSVAGPAAQERSRSGPDPDLERIAHAFDPDSVAAWEWAFPEWPGGIEKMRAAGFTAVAASDQIKPLTDNGFSLNHAIRWAQHFVSTPDGDIREWADIIEDDLAWHEAADWYDAGFSPQVCRWCVRHSIDLNTACDLRATDVDPADLMTVYESGGPNRQHHVLLPPDRDDQDTVIELLHGTTVPVADLTVWVMHTNGDRFEDAARRVHRIHGFPPWDQTGRQTGPWRTLMDRYRSVGVPTSRIVAAMFDLNVHVGLVVTNPKVHGSPATITQGEVTDDETAVTVDGLQQWRRRRNSHEPDDWTVKQMIRDVRDAGWVDEAGGWRNNAVLPALQAMHPCEVITAEMLTEPGHGSISEA